MEKAELPALFEGATHRIMPGGEPVKVTRWLKDGDHPQVERYPHEKGNRPGAALAFKGLLRAGPKVKFGLRFGEYIVEDAKGRLYIIGAQELPGAYVPLKAEGPGAVATAAMFIFAAACALLARGLDSDTPLLIGFGVTHLMYYSILLSQWTGGTNGVLDLDEANDDMRLSAHTNAYTPNQDTHNFFDDVTNEVTGTNYTAGGAALGSQTVSRSTGTVTFDASDVVWLQDPSGFSNARKFVLRRHNATPANAPLFSVVTADADVGNVTGDLTIAWHSSGIATWSTT